MLLLFVYLFSNLPIHFLGLFFDLYGHTGRKHIPTQPPLRSQTHPFEHISLKVAKLLALKTITHLNTRWQLRLNFRLTIIHKTNFIVIFQLHTPIINLDSQTELKVSFVNEVSLEVYNFITYSIKGKLMSQVKTNRTQVQLSSK